MKQFLLPFFLLSIVIGQTFVDYLDQGIVTPIEPMGTCRASWAFAPTAMYEAAMLKWTRGTFANITNATANTTGLDLSEQYVLECSGQGDCSGGSVVGALNFILTNGIPNQSAYGYGGLTTTYGVPVTTTVNASCSNFTNTTSTNVKVNTTLYLNQYTNLQFSQLEQLLNNFPAVGLMAVDSDFINYNGSLTPFNCTYNITSTSSQVNYAVLMIGYDANSSIII
jgi:C1A family cysteine protease